MRDYYTTMFHLYHDRRVLPNLCDGRTGQMMDVMIDTTGTCVVILLLSSYYSIWCLKNQTKRLDITQTASLSNKASKKTLTHIRCTKKLSYSRYVLH